MKYHDNFDEFGELRDSPWRISDFFILGALFFVVVALILGVV